MAAVPVGQPSALTHPAPPPNRYLSTCWMVQRLTSRRLASSRWLTPFDRSARMYSRCHSFRLGRRPGNRPSARAFATLRRKLGDSARNPRYIFTEPQVGYRMPKPD